MSAAPRIRIRCNSRSGIHATCTCGVSLHGSLYPLDLESVADWMREHWLVEHADRRELLRLAVMTVRDNQALAVANWREELGL